MLISWNQLKSALDIQDYLHLNEEHINSKVVFEYDGYTWTITKGDSGRKEDEITWYIERLKETNAGPERKWVGDLWQENFQWIFDRVADVERAQEEERLRIEKEEQQRLERERQQRERERKQAATEVETALSSAKKHLENNEFENANIALHRVQKQAGKCDMISKVSAMLKDIQTQLNHWMKSLLNDIEKHIRDRNWEVAKDALDSLSQTRLSSSGLNDKASQLRKRLNQEKVEWKKAEEERIRKEKEANEQKAREMVRSYLANWQPQPTISQIADNENAKSIFIDELLQSRDGEFLITYSEWQNLEEMITTVDKLWEEPQESIIHSELKDAIRVFSRDNVLTDDCLQIGFKEDDEWKTENMLLCIKMHDEELHAASMRHQNCIDQVLLEIFSNRFKDAYKDYHEQMTRRRNRNAAIRMVGLWLNLNDEDNVLQENENPEHRGKDLATLVSEAYRGDIEVKFKTPSGPGVLPKSLDNDAAREMIIAGDEIIITIEECYNVQEQQEQGHLTDEEQNHVHS